MVEFKIRFMRHTCVLRKQPKQEFSLAHLCNILDHLFSKKDCLSAIFWHLMNEMDEKKEISNYRKFIKVKFHHIPESLAAEAVQDPSSHS